MVLGAGVAAWRLAYVRPDGNGPGFNVLLMTLDTTRADRLGCYGYTERATPNIDRLASEGVRFAQCTSAVPSTLPSHATILTGLYPHVHGVRDNVGYRLSESCGTLAEALHATGYHTAAYVAAMVLARDTGLDQGFDTYDNVGTRHERRADEVCDAAIQWLSSHSEGKFFLWVHFFDPHFPYEPPDPFRLRFADPYVGEIAFVDQQVGRLLAELRRLNLEKNTLVVLTSDHGEGLGQHGEQTHLYFVYDTTLSVPLIIRCPGRVPSGRIVRGQVRTIDIAPTILAFLGIAPERALPTAQGRDLIPQMLGRAGDGDLPAYGESLSAHFVLDLSPLRCLRVDGWKYIAAPRPELYEVRVDPGEERNLAATEADRAAAMHEQLREIVATSPAPVRAADQTVRLDQETLDRLAGLGYVRGTSETSASTNAQIEDVEPSGADPKDHAEDLAAVGQAIQHLQIGQYSKAETIYMRLVKSFPGRSELSMQLARSLFLQDKNAEAIAIYRDLLAMHFDNADVHYALGKLLDRVGKRDEAVQHLVETVRLDPEYPSGFYDLGVILRKLDRADEALECFRQAVRVRPTHVDARINLGAALAAAGKLDEAIEQYREAIRVAPDDFAIHYNLGNALLRKGDRSGAIQAYQQALRLKPDFAPAREALRATQQG